MLPVPPHPTPRRRPRALWAALVVAILLAGCTRGEEATPDPASPPAGRSEAQPRPTGPESGATAAVDRESWSSVHPYSADSPWNTPIPESAPIHPRSDDYVERIGGPLTSDVSQYTIPVYEVDNSTPLVPVTVFGLFSDVSAHGTTLDGQWERTVEVPIPEGAEPALGTDSQMAVVNVDTGEEWGFWQMEPDGDGFVATNGYRYHVGWSAVPPDGFGSRGAGVPYLTGLIRPADIERGRIDHAIAFAYPTPSPEHVYPATKSDGPGSTRDDLPEGARLQLDPSLDDDDFAAMGLDETGRVIARALQEYGMILIDIAGRPKIYAESDETAAWGGAVAEDTVSALPFSAFRVLDWDQTRWGPVAQPETATSTVHGSVLTLDASRSFDPHGEVVAYEWATADGFVLGTEDDPVARWDTGNGEPGLQGFTLRVRDDEGTWSEPREVVVGVLEADGPFVSEVVEAAVRDEGEVELPSWAPDDEHVLLVAVNLRRLNVNDDVAVEELTGNDRAWTLVYRETDERGALAMEVWASSPGPGSEGPIRVRLTDSTNATVQAVAVAGVSGVTAFDVATTGQETTQEASMALDDADVDVVVGFHAGRTEDFVPAAGVAPIRLNTRIDDEGGSLVLSSVLGLDGASRLSGTTRSPMDWIMGVVGLSAGG
jgi:hypothetical protein